MDDFIHLLNGLNEAQRKAVEMIEGPVLVVAGPGTGKTQMLAVRIGNILQSTDAKPSDVLCLTYTEAGTAAMKKRLAALIGPDGHKVNVYTFHGFCNRVIAENPERFGRAGLRVMDELEREEILAGLLQELPAGDPLKLYGEDARYNQQALKQLFGIMQQEGFSSDWICQRIDDFLQNLPFNEKYLYQRRQGNFKKGDLNPNKANEVTDRLKKLRSAAALFDQYNERKKSLGLYEFDDMQRWVLQAFETSEVLLQRYQEQFLYFLADEFQDTSGVQNRLLEQLCNFWDVPNVFAVGDDDQSIYRFQGASVANIESYAQRYGEQLQTVIPTLNYRSTQPILDAADALISENKQRLGGQHKKLRAAAAGKESGPIPRIIALPNALHEAVFIADEVQAHLEAGIPAAEIAIIYRNHAHAERVLDEFRARGIPYQTRKLQNVLADPLILQLEDFLGLICDELREAHSGEFRLYRILHYGLYGVEPAEAAALAVMARKQNKRWRLLLAEQPRHGLSNPNLPGAGMLAEDLDYWLKNAPNYTVPELVERVIARGGFLRKALEQENPAYAMALLHSYHHVVKEDNRMNPQLTLSELLQRMERRRKAEINVPIEKRFGNETGVTFTTAHNSKGLEWEVVHVCACNNTNWENTRSKPLPFRMDEILDAVPESVIEDNEEVRRLFYVAMTRAGRHLTMTYPEFDNTRSLLPSAMLQVLQSCGKAETQKISVDTPALIAAEVRVWESAAAPSPVVPEQDMLAPILAAFELSPTAMQNYLKCRLSFYYRNILRIPQSRSEYASFGSAVHDALNAYFTGFSREGHLPDPGFLLEHFKKGMLRYRDGFTEAGFERRLKQGEDILPPYLSIRRADFSKETRTLLEYQVRTRLGDVPITGKMDKVVIDGHSARVCDYKTGDPTKGKNKLKPLKMDGDQWHSWGEYWLQLAFYQILTRHSGETAWQADTFEIDFVQPDAAGNYPAARLNFTFADIEAVEEKIQEVYAAIQRREFAPGCGENDCEWCNFARQYRFDVAPASNETEEDLNNP
jgi:DNA helicase-2/ATP-dependent DNA helicase PcrA